MLPPVNREELEKRRAHERYMRLQEQGKTEQARKDLGTRRALEIISKYVLFVYLFSPFSVKFSLM